MHYRDPRWASGGISKSNSGICTYEEWMGTKISIAQYQKIQRELAEPMHRRKSRHDEVRI